jgi:RNA polymerase sigma factor (sigma-70 family)
MRSARRTGNRALAEEIAQNVFTVLAQKAGRLQTRGSLGGWLYRATMHECSDSLRRQHAHHRKMNSFSRHTLDDVNGRNVWQDALPVLDEAIDQLSAADRDVVLLRFFERKSFREIAAALGKSEAAAQKQGERALARLATLLRRRGVVITAAMLASGLATQVAGAAPGALVQSVSQGALIGASQLSAKILILETIQAMTGTKLKTAVAVAVIAAVPLTMQWSANRDLRADVDRLQHELSDTRLASRGAAPKPSLAITRPPAARPANPAAPVVAPVETADAAAFARRDGWEGALLDPDPLRRAQRIAQLLAGLTAAQAPVVADLFERLKGSGMRFGEEERLFLHAWGRIDGQAAVDRTAVPTKEGVKSTPELLAALAGWAGANPNAARAWAESLPEGKHREDVIYGLLDGWSMVDFASAAAYAQSRPRSEARDRFIELLSQRSLAAGGIPAAQQWFAGIPNDEHNTIYKRKAFDSVIQAMLYRDPSAAAHWIAQSGGQSYVSSDSVSKTAVKLAEDSPAQAMHWMQSLSGLEQRQRRDGQVEVMEKWTRQDAAASGNWLAQQRNDPGYDQMAWRYATTISGTNPHDALAWAGSLGNAKEREAALREVAGYYLRDHGKQAEQYLLANGFTPGMVAKAKSGVGYADLAFGAIEWGTSGGGGAMIRFTEGDGAHRVLSADILALRAEQERAKMAEQMAEHQLKIAEERARAVELLLQKPE